MQFQLNIAQICLGLDIPDGYQGSDPLSTYSSFVSANQVPDAWLIFHGFSTLHADLSTTLSNPEIDELTRDFPVLRSSLAWDAYLKYHSDKHSLVALGKSTLVVFQPDMVTMQVFTFNGSDIPRYIESNTVRLIACLLSTNNGLLLHGAGLEKSGAAAAVIGPSGAGKSTLVSLVDHDFLLSEDIVAITDIDRQPVLHSTPLGGPTDGPHYAPLRAIFFVTKSAGFSLRRMGLQETVHRYVLEHADYISKLFQPYIALCFKNAYKLFTQVPVYDLCFSKDYVDREAVYRVLNRLDD